MSIFEIRTTRGVSIRAGNYADEAEAVTGAYEAGMLVDGDEVIAYPAEDVPVGLEGTDPEAD